MSSDCEKSPARSSAVHAVALVEEIVVVERLVPFVPVDAPLVLLRARLGDDVDDGAAVASVLGAVVVELDLHFADRVEVDRAAEHLRAAEIVADDSVDHHRVPGRAVAVDVRRRRSEVAARRIGRRLVGDAGQHAQQRDDVAAAIGDLLDLRGRDQRRPLGAERLHDAAGGRRGDRFGERPDVELQRADRHLLVRRHHGVPQLVGGEPGQLDADRVGARLDGREHECAGLVGAGDTAVTGLLVDERDGGARHELPRLIDDGAGHAAGDGLRHGSRGNEGGEREEGRETQATQRNQHQTSRGVFG